MTAITNNDAFDYIKIFLWEALFIILWALIPIVGWIIIFNRIYAYRMAYYLYHDYKFDYAKDAITESVKLMEGQNGVCLSKTFHSSGGTVLYQ